MKEGMLVRTIIYFSYLLLCKHCNMQRDFSHLAKTGAIDRKIFHLLKLVYTKLVMVRLSLLVFQIFDHNRSKYLINCASYQRKIAFLVLSNRLCILNNEKHYNYFVMFKLWKLWFSNSIIGCKHDMVWSEWILKKVLRGCTKFWISNPNMIHVLHWWSFEDSFIGRIAFGEHAFV